MKTVIGVSEENQKVIKDAAIGTAVAIGVLGMASGIAKSVAVYGAVKTGAVVVGACAVAYGGYRLHQSEQTLDMLLTNVKDRYNSKMEAVKDDIKSA
mgnify:CR=1 FL=1